MILFPRFRKRGPDVTIVPKNPVLQFGTIGLFKRFRVPGYHGTPKSRGRLDLFDHNFLMIKILFRETQYEER